MIILYAIVGIIAVLLITAMFVSKDMNYEKSIHINAPILEVWNYTSKLGEMDKWSPWQDRDPHMQKSFSGIDGEIGAIQSWTSKVKNVGEGSQEIKGIKAPNVFETKLEFIKPFRSTADGYVNLQENGSQTIVTWGFKSKMPYPMNLMKLFINFEKNMDADFGTGLERLKDLSEKN